MQDIGLIIWRTIITYFVILIIFRIMGKREIGELSILDLVVFVMLAEIAVFSIEEHDKMFLHALVPMLVLLIIQKLTAYLSLKSQKFREWFDGRPSVIVKHGKIDEYEMRKQKYNFNDLMLQLREKSIKNVQDVEFAILEPNGKLSVLEKSNPSDNNKQPEGYAIPLISDGVVQHDSLQKVQKDEEWLQKKMKKHGFKEYEEISFCTIDDQNHLYFDKKDEQK